MIERTFDARWFNALCNLPEVRPWLPGKEEIDVSASISNPANYALRTKHGGFILIAHGAGVYSVHTQFSSEGRGAHAFEAMRAGLDYMFTRTDCMRISTHCPDNNPPALALALKGGAKPWFRREVEPELGPAQIVAWDIFDWPNNTPDLAEEGEEFHRVCDEAIQASGLTLPEHPHDEVHNRYVGAAVRMCRRGQARKAVSIYNIWAVAASYPPATLINENPLLIDVGEGILMGLKTDGALEVLACPSA